MKFTRITAQPAVCTGKPCIRDLRFPVSRLLGLLAARQTPEEILKAYPYLEPADIDEAQSLLAAQPAVERDLAPAERACAVVKHQQQRLAGRLWRAR